MWTKKIIVPNFLFVDAGSERLEGSIGGSTSSPPSPPAERGATAAAADPSNPSSTQDQSNVNFDELGGEIYHWNYFHFEDVTFVALY